MAEEKASNDQKISKPNTPVYMQIISGLIVNLSVISPGMCLGFSAISLPSLTAEDNPARFTTDQASWFASIASMTMPLGCFLSGPIIDRLGRKCALYTINVFMIIGWMLIAFADTSNVERLYIQLLIGRFISGIGTGLCSTPATVYMCEISTISLRGMVCTWSSIAFALGVQIVYILGYIFKDQWQLVAIISGIIPFLCILLIRFLITESPVWYQNKGRHTRAENSLRKLQGYGKARRIVPPTSVVVKSNDTSQENKSLISENCQDTVITPILKTSSPAQTVYNETCTPCTEKETVTSKLLEKLQYFLAPECYKPFVIMVGYFIFQQLAGIFVIVFYAVDIVKEAGIEIDPYVAAIIIGTVRTTTALMVSYISNRFGRRPPSIVSGASMTICMLTLTIYLYLIKSTDVVSSLVVNVVENTTFAPTEVISNFTDSTQDSLSYILRTDFQWVPLVMLILYFCASTFGFLTIPFAMIGEVYPSKIRGLAGGLTTCIMYTTSFVVVKLYPTMLSGFGRPGLFLFYSIMSLFGTIFVTVLLPETKGKSLQEIEDYFRNGFNEREKNDKVELERVLTRSSSVEKISL